MGNLITYLKWRGDLKFEERAFGDVDNLVLSAFAYLDLSGIVPGIDGNGKITVAEAWEAYQGKRTEPESAEDILNMQLFEAMAESRRFGGLLLYHYMDLLDEEETLQFAALHIALGDKKVYVAFRGTGNELVGWREDFYMSFKVIPAQQKAVWYLEQTMEQGTGYLVGGHSKGGNLALFGAMMCGQERQGQILQIYSNDGPGLCGEVMDMEGYGEISDRLTLIIPEFSIIGTLFMRKPAEHIVGSSVKGAGAHDFFTWEIEGDHFCEKEELSEECRFYVKTFDDWIGSADMAQREVFARDFFDALEAGGVQSLARISEGGIDGFGTILVSIVESKSHTKIVIGKLLLSFVTNCRNIDFVQVLKSREAVFPILLFLSGVVAMMNPGLAVGLAGRVMGILAAGWSVKNLFSCAVENMEDIRLKKKKLLVYLGFICTAEFFLINQTALEVSLHILIGAGMLMLAVKQYRHAFAKGTGRMQRFFEILVGTACCMMGVVSIVTTGSPKAAFFFSLGSFAVIYAVARLLRIFYKNGKENVENRNN